MGLTRDTDPDSLRRQAPIRYQAWLDSGFTEDEAGELTAVGIRLSSNLANLMRARRQDHIRDLSEGLGITDPVTMRALLDAIYIQREGTIWDFIDSHYQ